MFGAFEPESNVLTETLVTFPILTQVSLTANLKHPINPVGRFEIHTESAITGHYFFLSALP